MRCWFYNNFYIVRIAFVLLLFLLICGSFFLFGGIFLKLNSGFQPSVVELPVGYDGSYYPKVSCTYFNKNISKRIKLDKKLNLNKIGKQSLVYSCKFLNFKEKKIFNYNIVDVDTPEIILNGDKEMSLYVGDSYEEKGAVAKDNYDNDLTSSIVIDGTVDTSKEGVYEIKYSVSDSSSNTSVIVRKVTIIPKPVYYSGYKGGGSSLGCGSAGVIYLTFDDGPGVYTASILDTLKKYGVKATFFVTSSGSDDLIRREINEGHAVGLHSASHAYNQIYVSTSAFWNDFRIVEARVKNISGTQPNLYRFPGGSSNTVSKRYSLGIISTLADELHQNGYEYFDWNISSGDAGGTTDPNVEYNNVVSSLSKSRGNVILMHDIKYHTAVALDSIVRYGIENGYGFDVLNTSISCHQKINN